MYISKKCLSGENLRGAKIDFNLVKYEFIYDEDEEILEKIMKKGRALAEKVNPAAANNGEKERTNERIISNCVSGVLAEYCWRYYLNEYAQKEVVLETEFTSASTQIDLMIKGTNKKIEIRSSFPRNGVEFAIFNKKYQFDVLGPYSNTVKPGEIQKDYYVRVLYPFEANDFLVNYKSSIEVYLSGGATWEMMNNSNFFKTKDLIPEDEIIGSDKKSNYRVVPLSIAYDTTKISNEIINAGF